MLVVDGVQYYIYGDAAYMLRPYMQCPFCTVVATPAQLQFNRDMARVRVAVEWNYKDLKQQWSTNDYPRMLRLRKAPVSVLYVASALLWNFRTCLYKGGQVSSYCDCPALSLHTYVNSD